MNKTWPRSWLYHIPFLRSHRFKMGPNYHDLISILYIMLSPCDTQISNLYHQNRWTVGLVTPRWFGCDQPILSLFRFRCHIQTRGGLLDQPSNGFGGDILTDVCSLNPCYLPKGSLDPRNLPSRSPNPRYKPTRKSNPRNSPWRSPKLRYSNLNLLELIYFLISTNHPCELTCWNIANRSNFTCISRIWTHFNVIKSKIPCKYQFL